MEEISKNPNTQEMLIPDSPQARFEQFYDAVEMMIIDGEMHSNEKALCLALAESLGFGAADVDTVIQGILEGNRLITPEEDIKSALAGKLLS